VSLVDALGASTATVFDGRRFCAPADKNDEDPDAPGAVDHLVGYRLREVEPFPRVRGVVVTNQFGPQTVDLVRPEMLLVPTAKGLVGPPPPPYVPAIDHYECYRASRARFGRRALQLEDQFGRVAVDVRRTARLCLAVAKDGGPILDPAAHLLCYRARSNGGRPRREPVFIANQFEERELRLFGVRDVCVPSIVDGLPSPPPP
jgi:hypothetical protein